MRQAQKSITLFFYLWLAVPASFTVQAGQEQIQALIAQGQLEQALKLSNQALREDPQSTTHLFLKGLILTRLDQLEQARDVFVLLTETHPELPEPYNNLAVVYAALGEFESAQQALQKAINTHPSYATAHENMGDLYARLASQAYNQALQLDQDNTVARAKLSLVNDLFSLPKPAPQPVAAAVRAPVAEALVPEPAPSPSEEDIRKQEEEQAARQAELRERAIQDIKQTVDNWAKAWSARDVSAYLSFYSEAFNPGGETRAEWEQDRTVRLTRPDYIRITLSDMQVQLYGEDHAQATFMQRYQSDTYGDRVEKILLLKKEDDAWLITEEMTR